jgi:aarF domain-containing kinase
MRTVLLYGRQCLHQAVPKFSSRCANRVATRLFANTSFVRRQFGSPRFRNKTILWSGASAGAAAGAILSPLAFVEIGQNESGNGEKTHEEAMLEASRKELDEQVPKSLQNSVKYRRGIYFFVEDYIIEPIATAFRFLHLVIIFVPVIVTIPTIWIGARQADRDNERSGTIWWYGFLVSSMERAGAAFIKVSSLQLGVRIDG